MVDTYNQVIAQVAPQEVAAFIAAEADARQGKTEVVATACDEEAQGVIALAAVEGVSSLGPSQHRVRSLITEHEVSFDSTLEEVVSQTAEHRSAGFSDDRIRACVAKQQSRTALGSD